MHGLLILADLFVYIFDLTCLGVGAAGRIIFLDLLDFDGASLVLLGRLRSAVLLELLATAMSREYLRVRSRTAVAALVLHELELRLRMRLLVFFH